MICLFCGSPDSKTHVCKSLYLADEVDDMEEAIRLEREQREREQWEYEQECEGEEYEQEYEGEEQEGEEYEGEYEEKVRSDVR